MPDERVFISFSGGRTSGYMTRHMLRTEPWKSAQKVVLFANTGEEDERTLRFVDQCDRQLGFNTVWIEGVTNPQRGIGQSAKVVDFASASRNGSPYESVIQKYGIPNKNFPHCTRELKLNPMRAYLRKTLGWEAGSYFTAVGIRADEMDRVNSRWREEKLIYPLIDLGVTKQDVLEWWSRMPFDLELPEHRGNCVWCWKKSLRKLLTLAKESPEVFDFPLRMEANYGDRGPGDFDRPRHFFRKNMSAMDLVKMAQSTAFEAFVDPSFDAAGSCSESCEIFADDDEVVTP